ncbi:MAG: hypothetical protein ACRC92_26140 [Peptostreptococcaceae bacterium]
MEKEIESIYDNFSFLTVDEYIRSEVFDVYKPPYSVLKAVENLTFLGKEFNPSEEEFVLSIAKNKDTELTTALCIINGIPLDLITNKVRVINDMIYVTLPNSIEIQNVKLLDFKSKTISAKFHNEYYVKDGVTNLFFGSDGNLYLDEPYYGDYVCVALDNNIVRVFDCDTRYKYDTNVLLSDLAFCIKSDNTYGFQGYSKIGPHISKCTESGMKKFLVFSTPSYTQSPFKVIVETFADNLELLDSEKMLPKEYEEMKDILKYKMSKDSVVDTFKEYILREDFMMFDRFYDDTSNSGRVLHFYGKDFKIVNKTPFGSLEEDMYQILVPTHDSSIKLSVFKNGRRLRNQPFSIYEYNRRFIYIPLKDLSEGDIITVVKERQDHRVFEYAFDKERCSTVHLPYYLEDIHNMKIYLNGLLLEHQTDYVIVKFELNYVLFIKRVVFINDKLDVTYNVEAVDGLTVEVLDKSEIVEHMIHLERQEIYHNGELLDLGRFVNITSCKSLLNAEASKYYDQRDTRVIVYNHCADHDVVYKGSEKSDWRNNIFSDPDVISYLKDYVKQFYHKFEGKYTPYERKAFLRHMFFTLFIEYHKAIVCDPFSNQVFRDVIKEHFSEIMDEDGFTLVLDCNETGHPRDMYVPLQRRIPLLIHAK